MKKTFVFQIGLIATVCLACSAKIIVSNVAPDIKMTMVGNDKGGKNISTKVIRRGGSQVAIITMDRSQNGSTNITASFLVDGVILLTSIKTEGDCCKEKFFIQNPVTHNVEGFERDSYGNSYPLPEVELEAYKKEVLKFQ
jgi:hypothetical protein